MSKSKSKKKPEVPVYNFVVKNDFNIGGAHPDLRKKKRDKHKVDWKQSTL